jgi:hypothetical protein
MWQTRNLNIYCVTIFKIKLKALAMAKRYTTLITWIIQQPMIYCAMLFNETKTIMQNQLWIFQIEINYQMFKIISMKFYFLISWEYNQNFLTTKTIDK